MKKNLGIVDRLVRLFIAIILFVYGLMASSWLALGSSIFVFYEALASWCIIYYFLGKTSCPIDKKK